MTWILWKITSCYRQTSYDWLRVVLVIFEVIGHATYLDIKTPFGSIYYATLMQGNGVDTSWFYKYANALTGFIYSFHMPVFIALSGCLFALKRYDLRSLVSKKFKRLLIVEI